LPEEIVAYQSDDYLTTGYRIDIGDRSFALRDLIVPGPTTVLRPGSVF
jgi:hypothetical protein